MGRRHDIAAPPPLNREAEQLRNEPEIQLSGWSSRKRKHKKNFGRYKVNGKTPITKPVTVKKHVPDQQELSAYKKQMRRLLRDFLRGKLQGNLLLKMRDTVGKDEQELLKYLRKSGMDPEHHSIDHIVPLALAKNKVEVNALFRWTNLQMMKREDNITKADSVPVQLHPEAGYIEKQLQERGLKLYDKSR